MNIHLNKLGDGDMPGLSPGFGRHLAEAAAVCLDNQKHVSGIDIQFTAPSGNVVKLEWSEVNDHQRNSYKDLQEATEYGACGIAILLMRHLTGKIVLERSIKGPGMGFDYWLGDNDNDDLFAGKTRLEVSGILSGNEKDLKTRATQKKKQMHPSSNLGPGYVGIIEFSKPYAHMEES